MSKKISGFNVERAADNTARSTVFDRIIKEIEPVEIPAKYVQRLQVHPTYIVDSLAGLLK